MKTLIEQMENAKKELENGVAVITHIEFQEERINITRRSGKDAKEAMQEIGKLLEVHNIYTKLWNAKDNSWEAVQVKVEDLVNGFEILEGKTFIGYCPDNGAYLYI
ncbi:hypothetical protein MK516_04580 [Streptococcus gallolyticus subsp. gallolyticus]|uniref:hypothetical protein n=1 Tax=Streptococcus gallolyticus TaxID=315405 RepID=UPI002284A83C|nr:hypothetical protein [Streptococcus gallolyticus]MCY7171796.1 hypothetical protein [Streptococcus gallolyticus subsp. gallolyticus]